MGNVYGEEVAYQAYLVLGFPYIPLTVIRQLVHMYGFLHLFVDTSIDALAPEIYKQALVEADSKEVANLKVFYFVFGQ